LDVLLAARNLADVLQIGLQQLVRFITERLIPVFHNISPDDGRIHQPPWDAFKNRRLRDLTRSGSAEMSLSALYRAVVPARTSVCNSRADAGTLPHVIASFGEMRKTRRKNFQFLGKDFRDRFGQAIVALKQGGDSHQNSEAQRDRAQSESAQWIAAQGVGITNRTISDCLGEVESGGAGFSAQQHG
jgi:hypothetical protein